LGYSARYHAASLAAVFLALAVGILIGAGLGSNFLSDTEDNLRESLEGDIDDARSAADDLQTDLDRERAFTSRAYPALVGDTLADRRIGVLAFGDLPSSIAGDIEEALDPTGAELSEIAVVRIPPDVEGLADELAPKFRGLEKDPARIEDLGERLGAQFVAGEGGLFDQVRNTLFQRSSGEGGKLNGVVLVRGSTGIPDPEEDDGTTEIESGLVRGIAGSGVNAVAVERTDTEESSVPFFASFDVSTVDSIDLTSGQVAMVFALLGADGNFGIKSTAGSLLPELLVPAKRPQR
jgi:hypothetical protein